jgi:uncharacterized cupredoxin-like copper-binding protein
LRLKALRIARHEIELHEYLHLGAQYLGNDRRHDAVDRAERIAFRAVHCFGVCRQEDDRRVGALLAAAYVAGGLETVHSRHVDVEQDDGEFALEHALQRFLTRLCGDDVLSQLGERAGERDQVGRPIVHDEDAGLLRASEPRYCRHFGVLLHKCRAGELSRSSKGGFRCNSHALAVKSHLFLQLLVRFFTASRHNRSRERVWASGGRMQGNAVCLVLIAAFIACAPMRAAATHADSAQEHALKLKKKRAAAEHPYGREGDPRKVKRVIRIEMSDTMQYFPSQFRVKRGDTVRFVLNNGGQLPHELVIGTMEELKKHAAHMKKNADMNHPSAHAAHVAPGASERLVWQFTKPGEFHYACLVPGHFEAGMIGTIVVR